MAGFGVVAVSHREGLWRNLSAGEGTRVLLLTPMGRQFRIGGHFRARAERRFVADLSGERIRCEGRLLRAEPRRISQVHAASQRQSVERFPEETGETGAGANLLATAALWLLMLLSATLPLFLGGVSEMGDLWFRALGAFSFCGWCFKLLRCLKALPSSKTINEFFIALEFIGGLSPNVSSLSTKYLRTLQ